MQNTLQTSFQGNLHSLIYMNKCKKRSIRVQLLLAMITEISTTCDYSNQNFSIQKKNPKFSFYKIPLHVYIRSVKKYKSVVLLFVQRLARAQWRMRYKADGCFRSAAVKAELLFCRLRGRAAGPGAGRALPAGRAACAGRGWRRGPGSAPAPAARESRQRHPAPPQSPASLPGLKWFRSKQSNASSREC